MKDQDTNELEDWGKSKRIPVLQSKDPVVKVINKAIQANDWLEITYSGGNNPGTSRRIKPINIFSVEGYNEIYLKAFCSTRNEERTFRIDRIQILDNSNKSIFSISGEAMGKTEDTSQLILDLITNKPGIKAEQIAASIGIEKKQVNLILYGMLKGKIFQDKSYKWWPQTSKTDRQQESELIRPKDTKLARLCQYYLDCLGQDEATDISLFASSRYSLEYLPISIPLDKNEIENQLFEDAEAKKMLNQARSDRARLQLSIGYPIRLNRIRSKKGWEGMKVEPLFLYNFSFDPINRNTMPVLEFDLPQINFKFLRSSQTSDSGNIIDEAIQLTDDLGLNNPQADVPDIDDLVARLTQVRQPWDWQEDLNPFELCADPSIASINQTGIYNRAILFVRERSHYTQGLETELANLCRLDEVAYSETALGKWLRDNVIEANTLSNEPLLEILPLNTEQRQAVNQGLSNSLTVITGPPGTGKSQVVTSLLTNAAWQGKKVLFASKNNKAVDVVEIRTNALGPLPILLRLGRNEYQSKLSEYLTSLLSATATRDDELEYERQYNNHNELQKRFNNLERLSQEIVKLRNEVDHLEQSIEHVRISVGDKLFRHFRLLDLNRVRVSVRALSTALRKTNRSEQFIITKILWSLVRNRRFARVTEIYNQYYSIFQEIGISLPTTSPMDDTISEWSEYLNEVMQRIKIIEQIQCYFIRLEELSITKPLEELSRDYAYMIEELSSTSEQLWQSWLRLRPNKLTQQERRLLSEYSSLLQIKLESNTANKSIDSRYQAIQQKITNILSCWAVTSLSAWHRIPLDPGFFDLLVIDEASQCDIASALPLLYRAKQAVIIGDPQQLKHISSISPRRDSNILVKHGFAINNTMWAYSVKSLFDLACSLCQSKDIISLRDHHRSHSDIIQFANDNFYKGYLRIATKYEHLKYSRKNEPAIRWINTRGQVIRPSDGGAVNQEEAVAVIKELERLVLDQGYNGTIGVVTPFRSQANRIRDLAQQNDRLFSRLVELEFLSDTVHKFQGDERDLMIFSPVVSNDISDGSLQFLRKNPYLFNVAITRARSTLIVIGDRQAAIDSGVDYLKKFALYVEKLGSKKSDEKKKRVNCGAEYPPVADPSKVSHWEKIFYRYLYSAGIRAIPQYDVDQYIIDFAIIQNSRKLAIEVDGERYHRDWDGELCRRDQIRNQRLIELGWDIMRFWVYQIRDDTENCIVRIKKWIEQD